MGEGSRGVRVMGLVGNWEPVVEEGESSCDVETVEGEVGDGIRGELWALVRDRKEG